jgi:hypothetical protein
MIISLLMTFISAISIARPKRIDEW